jgi:hypothetical protein
LRQTDPQKLKTEYLLGTSSEDDKTMLEERYFADDAEFEQIEILEEELADRYVRNELSATERDAFEKRLAESSSLRERVGFAQLFKTKLAGAEIQTAGRDVPAAGRTSQNWRKTLALLIPPAPRAALALGLTVVLVACVVAILGWMNLRRENNRISQQLAAAEQQRREMEQQVADEKSRADQLASDLQQARQQDAEQTGNENVQSIPKPEPTTAFLSLFAGATRSAGQRNELTIGPSIKRINVTVRVPQAGHTSYNVTVTTPEGEVVHREQGLRSRRDASANQSLTFQVPAGSLKSGDYIVNVDGLTPAGASEFVIRHSFQLTRKQ